MNVRRILVWVTILIVLAGIVIAVRYANMGINRNASHAPVIGVAQLGQQAPAFSAATNQGFFDLSKTPNPVFLEIFATWCPHCQRETTVIDKLYQRYKNRVDFIGVSGSSTGMDGQSPSSEQDVLEFASKLHAQYPLAYDGSLDIAHKYLQGGFPTLVVIGRDKRVAYLSSGETSYAELDTAIQRVM